MNASCSSTGAHLPVADLVQRYTAEVARDREQPLTPKRSPVSDLELAPAKLRVLLNCCQQRIFEGAGLVEVQAHIDEAAQLCEGGTICGLGPSREGPRPSGVHICEGR